MHRLKFYKRFYVSSISGEIRSINELYKVVSVASCKGNCFMRNKTNVNTVANVSVPKETWLVAGHYRVIMPADCVSTAR